jgi:hypothetical protein
MRQWTSPVFPALEAHCGRGSTWSGDDLADGEERVWRKGDARISGLDWHFATARTAGLSVTLLAYMSHLTRVALRLPQHAIRCEASVVIIPGGRK